MECVGKLGEKLKEDRCLSILKRKDRKLYKDSIFTCPKCSVIIKLPWGHYNLIEEDKLTNHVYEE